MMRYYDEIFDILKEINNLMKSKNNRQMCIPKNEVEYRGVKVNELALKYNKKDIDKFLDYTYPGANQEY